MTNKYYRSTLSKRKKSNEIHDKLSDHFAGIRTHCLGKIFNANMKLTITHCYISEKLPQSEKGLQNFTTGRLSNQHLTTKSLIQEGFHFRWLKIKGLFAAFPISLTLFSNHPK